MEQNILTQDVIKNLLELPSQIATAKIEFTTLRDKFIAKEVALLHSHVISFLSMTDRALNATINDIAYDDKEWVELAKQMSLKDIEVKHLESMQMAYELIAKIITDVE